MTTITRVMTSNPAEHQNCYSRITKADRWVYSSTTAGKNYVTGVLPDDVIEQTRQAFANIEQALAAVGAELIDSVRVDICLADGRDIGAVLQEVNRLVGDIPGPLDPGSCVRGKGTLHLSWSTFAPMR